MSVDLVESVDLVSVVLVVNCTYAPSKKIFGTHSFLAAEATKATNPKVRKVLGR